VIAAVLGVLSVGAGLAAEVSNCNRDCSDGAGMMYGAFVFAGLGVGSLVLAIVPPRRKPEPPIPPARVV
jgi:hypothetical protein